ncbi:uncharacterized protein N7443_001048 [Penicillium atrosanguineum]|uniref:uncharacterized protein n=1 Tax=Penicillium atrosanguineum TaxID=1132637 RepID=UPI0023A31C9F|nr:uncharacterized protein N7443_001048 [Penicillium atrosanguineum]KAJ5314164.1 hypothetical protein N7443_001048 [Penicillium atrosanguineum]
MSMSKIAGVILGSAALVAGHGYVSGAVVDGTYYGGYLVDQYNYETDPPETIGWSEDETDNGYIDGSEYANANIICHKDGKPGAISAPVKAGGSVELQWTDWPSSHHGPVITYLANCNGDCSDVTKTDLKFFKIDAGGLIDDADVPGTWATDKLISNNNSRTITIPSTIESGNYVLRHEIIALHSAENTNGAQNYPQCLNLKVTGGGSDSPTGTLGTELYKNTDAGILVNIYQSLSTYDIPGPALYTAGSASSATTTTAAAAAASTTAAAVSAATTVSSAPIRSPSAFPSVPSFRNSTRVPLSRGPASARPQFTQPTVPLNVQSAATVTDHATATVDSVVDTTVTAQVTDQPAFQTASAQNVDTVTATASAAGQSAQSTSTPSTGSDSTGSSDSSSSSGSSSGSESSGSTGTTAASTATTTSEPSHYNYNDWTSYLSTLSASQVLDLLRETFGWLVADKKHARDLTSLAN